MFTGTSIEDGVLVFNLQTSYPGVTQCAGRLGAAAVLDKAEMAPFGGFRAHRDWPNEWPWEPEQGTLDGERQLFDVCRSDEVCVTATSTPEVDICLVTRGDYVSSPIRLRQCDSYAISASQTSSLG